jgi:fatty acid desaturase
MGLVDKLLAWAIFGFLALVMIMALCMIVYYLSLFFSEIRYEKERRMQNINEKTATTSENSGADDK